MNVLDLYGSAASLEAALEVDELLLKVEAKFPAVLLKRLHPLLLQ